MLIDSRDHPRTRGEKSGAAGVRPVQGGSPPHTRGKDGCSSQHTCHARITPAHAGKRYIVFITWAEVKDHPRTRGEKNSCMVSSWSIVGSPPHTRGKEAKFLSTAFNNGITPAHAGKSEVREGGAARGEDHPRTRGEKHGYTARCQFHLGSPPHTRGKVLSKSFTPLLYGITPAHAGKSIISFMVHVTI